MCVSNATDTLDIEVAIVLLTVAIRVSFVVMLVLFIAVSTDTAAIRDSKVADVPAKVEDTPAIRVSNVADTLAMLVASVAESVATVEDVATDSPPTNIFVASTVVALIVPALTVVANKLPVRKLLTLTS